MIELYHPRLSIRRQCELVGLNRSSVYYQPACASPENLHLMRLMDEQYLKTPFYGSRRMTAWLTLQGLAVNRKRVQRLMRLMGLEAIYPRPRTSLTHPSHKIYPYLLRDLAIIHPHQVWSTDITYIPMPQGFLYLVAIMDWYSRCVLSWQLSNTLEVDFCIEVLEEALRNGQPEIFNTDQGAQFTSQAFTGLLEQHGVRVSMDGKGRYTDNLFIERLWRSPKYEEVYLKAYAGGREARAGIGGYFDFFNLERPHQALGYQTPAEVFISRKKTASPADLVESRKPSRLAEPTETVGPALNSAFLLSN